MEVMSTSVSPTPDDRMDREPRLATHQAESSDREEPRVELTSFTRENGNENGGDQTPTWVNQTDKPEEVDREVQRGMRTQPFQKILRAIERREEGARGDGPWDRVEREGEVSFKNQRGVQWETPTVRHRD